MKITRKVVDEKTKLKEVTCPELKHALVRGKARNCIKCSFKYGCCKICNLCKNCHHDKFGVTSIGQDLDQVERDRLLKYNAIHNPGLERYYLGDYYNEDDDF